MLNKLDYEELKFEKECIENEQDYKYFKILDLIEKIRNKLDELEKEIQEKEI